MSNSLNFRLINLHNTQEVWERDYLDFTPQAGELVVYDPDSNNPYARFKIGDGATLLVTLPFYNSGASTDLSGAITWEGDVGFIDSGNIKEYIKDNGDN